MFQLAIDILWLLLGIIVLAGIVWLVIYGINKFVYQLPLLVVQGIWFIVLILVIIAAITLLAGGGSRIRGPSFWRSELPNIATTAQYMPRVLNLEATYSPA